MNLQEITNKFIADISKEVSEKEITLDRRAKELASLNEREKKIAEVEVGLNKERVLLEKEKSILNEKQHRLELKEQDLVKKIQKVNQLLQN